MAKRCALYFGAAGYLLPLWYYGWLFAPVTSEWGQKMLVSACIGCPEVFPLASGIKAALIFLGPLNALIYATVGFLIGKAIQAIRRRAGADRNSAVERRD